MAEIVQEAASETPSGHTRCTFANAALVVFRPDNMAAFTVSMSALVGAPVKARSSVVSRKAVQQRGARLVVRAEGEEAEAKADALAGLKPTKCADFKSMSNDELNAQIVDAKKKLFELRMRQSTRKEYKGHHFGILKTKIAQIRTVKREREVTEGVNKRDSRKIKREERAANIYL